MERETVSFETPKGNKVSMYTYITGRERRDMQNIFLKDAEMSTTSGEIEMTKFKASTINEANDFLMKTLLASFNGEKENAFDRVLDLPADEFEYIKTKIDETSKSWEVKKN